MVGAHHQARVDQDDDGWANLPGVQGIEARPRLFYDGRDGTSLCVTAGVTAENRTGGNALRPATLALRNAVGTTRTSGGEFFAVYNREPLVVTALYSYVDAREPSVTGGGPRVVPRTPRQAGGIDVMLEADEIGTTIALEAFYPGQQALDQDIPLRREPHRRAPGAVRPNLASREARGRAVDHKSWAPLEGRQMNLGIRRR